MTRVSNLLTSERGPDIVVATIELRSRPTAKVVIPLASGDATEGVVSPPALTFTPDNYSIAQAFTVVGVDDQVDDGNVVYTADIGPASSGDPAYQGLDPQDLSIISIDSDGPIEQPPTVGFALAGSAVLESDRTATVHVQLSKPSGVMVAIHYGVAVGGAAKAPGDYSLAPGVLVFAPGEIDKSFIVTITDDSAPEGGETIRLKLEDGPIHARLGRNEHTLSIVDDDGDSGSCQGKPVTPGITVDGNTITGTDGDDVILGLPGNDVILGLGGNDVICGGVGNDRILGGAGNDVLAGNGGNDVIEGDEGNDLLLGRDGNDDLGGGPGVDRLVGGDGEDFGQGGSAADVLNGGVGNDTLRGGAGADRIFGRVGDDRLSGGPGMPDLCSGGAGTDTQLPGDTCETATGIP